MIRFDPTLYLITDSEISNRSTLLETVQEAVRGGVTMVQLRRKNDPRSDLLELGRALRAILSPLGVPLIVNDFPEAALSILADGVHLGFKDMSPRKAREILGPKAVIGLSIESADAMNLDDLAYADYLAASPVFDTQTKRDTANPLGIEGLRKIRSNTNLPLVAIGGIQLSNIQQVREAGADGVAVVSAIFNSRNPRTAAENLRQGFLTGRSQSNTKIQTGFRTLTIAGSDSGGGAGIQADLKTFQALDCYGMSVLTAVTAQNTVGVRSIFPISTEAIRDQLEAVIEDIGVDAVKIGMLFSKSIIETVAGFLKENKIRNVILDPVMVAKGGHRLLEDQAIEALRSELLPLALLVTPNLPEAEALTGLSAQTEQAQIQMAETLLQTCHGTVIKGGHGPSWTKTLKDFVALADGTRLWIERERVYTENTHGTGCTFSSAITAYLARGFSLLQSIEKGRDYLQGALGSGANKTIGKGHGPVDHAWNLRRHLE